MSINWFPGHMLKARKEIERALPKIDVLIEVLDARIPQSSSNPLLQDIIRDKPRLLIFNKADLACAENVKLWREHFEAEKLLTTMALGLNKTAAILELGKRIKILLQDKIDANKAAQAMIIGIPNVGKSTIINSLAGRQIAKTGNEPAVTRHQQRIILSEHIHLTDTPGLLYPKIFSEAAGLRLALTGAVRATAFAYDEIGMFAAEIFAKNHPQELRARYEIDELANSALEILEQIGRARGALGKGNIVDLEQASRILINDYRQGALGLLALETPAQISHEIAAQQLMDARAADLKLKNKQARRAKYLKNRNKR